MEVSGFLMTFIVVFALSIFGLWFWSLIHCIINKNLSETNKIIGIVLIVILGLIGSLVYLFLPREKHANSQTETEDDLKRYELEAGKIRMNSR